MTTFKIKNVFGFVTDLTRFVENVVTGSGLFLFDFGFGRFFRVVYWGRGRGGFVADAGGEGTGVVAFTIVFIVIIFIVIIFIIIVIVVVVVVAYVF